jgi:hypothetical protein
MREYSAFWLSINGKLDDLHRLPAHRIPLWIATKLRDLVLQTSSWLPRTSSGLNGAQPQLGPSEARIQMARRYHPAPYSGKVLLFKRFRELTGRYRDPQFGWGKILRGDFEISHLNAIDHLEIFKSEFDRTLVARKLRAILDDTVALFSTRNTSRKLDYGFEGHNG